MLFVVFPFFWVLWWLGARISCNYPALVLDVSEIVLYSEVSKRNEPFLFRYGRLVPLAWQWEKLWRDKVNCSTLLFFFLKLEINLFLYLIPGKNLSFFIMEEGGSFFWPLQFFFLAAFIDLSVYIYPMTHSIKTSFCYMVKVWEGVLCCWNVNESFVNYAFFIYNSDCFVSLIKFRCLRFCLKKELIYFSPFQWFDLFLPTKVGYSLPFLLRGLWIWEYNSSSEFYPVHTLDGHVILLGLFSCRIRLW